MDGEWSFDDGRFQFGVDTSKVTMTTHAGQRGLLDAGRLGRGQR